MADKYEVESSKWPKEEVAARDAARRIESEKDSGETIDVSTLIDPPLR